MKGIKQEIHDLRVTVVRLPWAVAAMVVFLGGVLGMQVQLDRQRNDFEASIKSQVVEGAYQGEIHAYEDKVVEYQICLAAVNARKDQIIQWDGFYDQLTLLFLDNDNITHIIKTLHDKLDENLPPLDESQCVRPVKPERGTP